MSEKNELAVKWVKLGIVCGILGDLCYGLAIGLPMPKQLANVVFWSFGPLLIAGSPGIYYFIKQHKNSIPLQLGTLFMMIAGFAVTLMAVVQRSLFETFHAMKPEAGDAPAYQAWRMGLASGNSVQLGMDIVWDIFIMVGMILLALAMFSHPRLGKTISITGIAIGLAGLFFNVSTFPTPPGEAGSFDIGPLVGLWFLAVAIVIIFSFRWLRRTLEQPAVETS